MLTTRDFLRLCKAIAKRPGLWRTAVRQGLRFARRDWWRTLPFLPLPSPAYLEFRAITHYGNPKATPVIADVLDYLEWCRDWDSTGGARERRCG
ncbi:MAG: hypothetical protein ABIQ38_01540 [Ilumatobacteraceae bacterium]